MNLRQAYDELHAWTSARGFAGHDPFDALNSRLFQLTPLKGSRIARLAWTQTLKRAPFNLRTLASVPPQRNPKGTALFALAALSRYRADGDECDRQEALDLLDDLAGREIKNQSGACWGYNFDWQGRAFYAARNTPTIVPTAFVARAFLEASIAFDDKTFLAKAGSVCEFIKRDLPRSFESDTEICFSYTTLDRTQIFNASLLAAETLAATAELTGEIESLNLAQRAARFVINRQRADGSWSYGTSDYQSWADNFHTAFVLLSLTRIVRASRKLDKPLSVDFDRAAAQAIKRGCEFWTENFFLPDGCPKYFHNRVYPVDAHAAASAIVALLELQEYESDAPQLAERIAAWTLANMRDRHGFFYYQKRRGYTVRTPFMRWTQGWMQYALARLIELKDEG